jgi:hypothetical protein
MARWSSAVWIAAFAGVCALAAGGLSVAAVASGGGPTGAVDGAFYARGLIALCLLAAGGAAARGVSVVSGDMRSRFADQGSRALVLGLFALVCADAGVQFQYWLSSPAPIDDVFCSPVRFDYHALLVAAAGATGLLSLVAGIQTARRVSDGRIAMRRSLAWPLLVIIGAAGYQGLFELPRCEDLGGLVTAASALLAIPYAVLAAGSILLCLGIDRNPIDHKE